VQVNHSKFTLSITLIGNWAVKVSRTSFVHFPKYYKRKAIIKKGGFGGNSWWLGENAHLGSEILQPFLHPA
jgi:hypothetical protein